MVLFRPKSLLDPIINIIITCSDLIVTAEYHCQPNSCNSIFLFMTCFICKIYLFAITFCHIISQALLVYHGYLCKGIVCSFVVHGKVARFQFGISGLTFGWVSSGFGGCILAWCLNGG